MIECLIRKEDLALVFPYYMLLDYNMDIVECGEYIKGFLTICKKRKINKPTGSPHKVNHQPSTTQATGKELYNLAEVALLISPDIELTADNIMAYINNMYIVAFIAETGPKKEREERRFILQGELSFKLMYK